MKRLAVLGPKGTYSDIAKDSYIKTINKEFEIVYYPSILKTGLAVDDNTIAILPFENTLDGFVLESMDVIIKNNLHISSQLKLDIDFAFISNAKSIDDVKEVYCQFKAYGQCLDFISSHSFNIITTQSNMESFELLMNKNETFGAIIPLHVLHGKSFNTTILHIADSKSNQTRFFVVEKNASTCLDEFLNMSIVITAIEDRPGILFDILKQFHDFGINLKSILSRPMKTEMGKYKFYIECEITNKQLNSVEKLQKKLDTDKLMSNVLGIYNSL